MVCRFGFVSRLTCAHDLANGECDKDHKPCLEEGRANETLWIDSDLWGVPKIAVEEARKK